MILFFDTFIDTLGWITFVFIVVYFVHCQYGLWREREINRRHRYWDYTE